MSPPKQKLLICLCPTTALQNQGSFHPGSSQPSTTHDIQLISSEQKITFLGSFHI